MENDGGKIGMNADDKMMFLKFYNLNQCDFQKFVFWRNPMGASYVDMSTESQNKDDLSMPCEHGVSRNLWRSEKLKM